MADYRNQALQQLNPVLNQKIQALKNAADTTKQSLEQSKTGINTNFDTQVDEQNLQNTSNKNNISNSALGRGLGRSSIVTSGLGEADQINTRYLDKLKTARTNALNDVESQKALIDTNTNNSVAQLQSDSENEALTLARQLENEAWERNFKERQLAESRAAARRSSGLSNNMSAGSAYNKEISDINDLVSGKYNLSEKQRVLQQYITDKQSQNGVEAQALTAYAQKALENVSKQMQDFVNSGRYAGYENRRY